MKPLLVACATGAIVALTVPFAAPAATASDVSARGDVARAPVTAPIAAPRWIEIPGEMEFTGRLLLRPLSADEHVATGGALNDAARREAVARARIEPLVVEYAAGPDRYTIDLPAGETEQSYADALLATGDYAWVQPDWQLYPIAVPNDPQYGSQWQHVNMQSESGWDTTVGNPQIIAAFVDTGVDLDHEDLAGALVPGFNSVDDLAQVDGGEVGDTNGHGTAVGGCIGAIGNNGVGMAGVCWNVSLMPIKTSNSPGGGAALSNILQGAEWAVENGAKTASCSYTGIQSPAIQDSGAYIKSIGGLLLYAANNSNQNHSGFDWPDVVVVGATDQNDNKAGFSSYGIGVDLFAPGVGVGTTQNGGGYGGASGTSFATPIANGVAAFIWSIDPSLTPDEVQIAMYLSCDDLGVPGNDDFFGWGRVNLRIAAQFAELVGSPQPPTPTADSIEAIGGVEVLIDVLANDVDLNLDELELVSVDATSALGGTMSVVPGGGPEGRDVIAYVGPLELFELDSFQYVVGDGTLTSTGDVTVDLIDPSSFRAPDSPAVTSPGATVDYYVLSAPSVLPDFDTLESYASDVVVAVDFPSTNGDFVTSGRNDDVGAVFLGFIEVPAVGTYTLSVESDDGSKLYVGGDLLIDNDGLHGMVEVAGDIGLQPGKHAIRVEFFERGGGAGCIVRIEGGGLPRQIVPPSMWSFEIPDPCPTDLDDSGATDFTDVLTLLSQWGDCPPGGGCSADFDADGAVTFEDLVLLLSGWGACPG